MPDAKITALILVPEEGDPCGLLREGPCGARPPTLTKCSGLHWVDPDGNRHLCPECGGILLLDQRALVLGYKGDLTPWAWGSLPEMISGGVRILLLDRPDRVGIKQHVFAQTARDLASRGSLLALDGSGREVRHG